jgi:hypothetical protein
MTPPAHIWLSVPTRLWISSSLRIRFIFIPSMLLQNPFLHNKKPQSKPRLATYESSTNFTPKLFIRGSLWGGLESGRRGLAN